MTVGVVARMLILTGATLNPRAITDQEASNLFGFAAQIAATSPLLQRGDGFPVKQAQHLCRVRAEVKSVIRIVGRRVDGEGGVIVGQVLAFGKPDGVVEARDSGGVTHFPGRDEHPGSANLDTADDLHRPSTYSPRVPSLPCGGGEHNVKRN